MADTHSANRARSKKLLQQKCRDHPKLGPAITEYLRIPQAQWVEFMASSPEQVLPYDQSILRLIKKDKKLPLRSLRYAPKLPNVRP